MWAWVMFEPTNTDEFDDYIKMLRSEERRVGKEC